MRGKIAIGLVAGALVFGGAGAAFAKPPPLSQVCSAASNGGTLVSGVCVLPGATAGGGNEYFGYVIANNSEPSGADTFSIVSGSLPPGLSMPSQYGAADTVITGVATQLGTFEFVVKAADPDEGLSSLQSYSIKVSSPPPDKLVCSPGSKRRDAGQRRVRLARRFCRPELRGVHHHEWQLGRHVLDHRG